MSQIVLDEHLGRTEVLEPLWKWITAAKIEEKGVRSWNISFILLPPQRKKKRNS